jgi:aminoglycoside phosphotransferase (APT) family kinase protein
MRSRSGAQLTLHDGLVHKLHRPGTDPRALTARLRAAATVDELLTPVSSTPERIGERWRTRWPYVEVLAPEPESVRWPDIARLLARLHAAAVDQRLPVHGWPARLRRAVALARGNATVVRAAAALPAQTWRGGSAERPRTLVHGDFHLGQVGRRGADDDWCLIDIDDLGVGDPAWDLARPAGFWAAGLIPDEDWTTFVDGYRAAGGLALPPGDPWPVLEPFARAAVIQAAANHPDDAMLMAACAQMPQLEKKSRPKPCLR